ncbi:MAG: hypothetical protein JWM80_6685 [Cyanobacteria bacterium RYN_339]|nr:hypothetical protein [Cyanobacteria bacterium RYN_339]
MRFLIKAIIPTDRGNELLGSGRFAPTMQAILAELKPENAYFALEDGCRTGYFFVNIDDPSEIPGKCEPLFMAFNAKLEVSPCMVPEDLGKAGADIERAGKAYFRQPAGVH